MPAVPAVPAETATRRWLSYRLHPADNVATALAPLAAGTVQHGAVASARRRAPKRDCP